ncbi:MAG: ABC transporter ATP-binding protein [Aminobacterium sp.]|jgi:oligopeptide/dipeptide ABC transporter ATP-binding protein|uniref:ABC transporter ATP-binding protein n=1 Tax=unclassified Aminobacterium TaxID=2685012 RepID=UPI001BCAC2DB|nr:MULTISPECIES: ABC transporter ATP-binding protein [unclassified Aminobacterium]MDD2206063.1 ABC transporter ATP-binding protein [Aminobacterium sp.]MDD3426178.1 ABC transporter ATP-binding protein [Aminobacterium sp.]MDD3707630.1 ABC transporter ATP-binding protein [Aminobacterium sp.]MDD4227780.1 ABC transporter ATP-binding protein [Aminobacterium sp.]MDD4550780.1 ABC transporter ATP-binding protein [Aminobacterium sp.]
MNTNDELLRVEDLTTWFYTEGGIVKALENVSFSIKKGEILGLVGETGCGKSVTSSCIMRLIPTPPGKIMGGKIMFEDRNLLDLSANEMRKIRGNEISMIFQDPMSCLNPVYKVGFQVQEAIQVHQRSLSLSKVMDKVKSLFSEVNIPDPDKSIDRYPHQFSGGMKQRVMISMALSSHPKLLIADEPTTALDVSIQAQILSLIKKLQKDYGTSILLISHDLGVIASMAQKVAVMYAGSIIEYGTVQDIFNNPLHPYTKGLLGAIPRLDRDQEWLQVIKGSLPNLMELPQGCKFQARCECARPECSERRPERVEVEKGHEVACHVYSQGR